MVTQLIKTLMASTEEVNDLEDTEKEEVAADEIDMESRDYQRQLAEISSIIDNETESISQLSQATGKWSMV